MTIEIFQTQRTKFDTAIKYLFMQPRYELNLPNAIYTMNKFTVMRTLCLIDERGSRSISICFIKWFDLNKYFILF